MPTAKSAAAAPAPKKKPAAPRKKAATPAVAAESVAAPAPVVLAESAPVEAVIAGPVLKLKDLVTRVVAATGGKKKGVKEVVEATLHALGDALSKGEDLNLPPLGRAKVNRQKDMGSGELLIVKLRRGGGKENAATAASGKKPAKEPLADAEE